MNFRFDALSPAQEEELEQDRLESRANILRVFNHYRVFLSFALLLLFLQPMGDALVGTHDPDMYLWSSIAYVIFNVTVIVTSALISAPERLGKTWVISSVLILDIIMLSLMVYSSGGVSSSMGNLLVFPVAFAGVLIVGQSSVVLAAIAVILSFYSELHLMFSQGGVDLELLFGAGMLGIVLFVVNILFQYLSRQLRKKESEVITLEQLNAALMQVEAAQNEAIAANSRFEVLVKSAGEGVLGVHLDGTIEFANPKACELLESTQDELAGRNVSFFSRLKADEEADGSFISSDILRQLQAEARSPSSENQWQTFLGNTFDVDYSCEATSGAEGDATGGVIVFQDVSERREVERKLNYMANYDSLTDLVNRSFFKTELDKSIARARRNDSKVAVFLLDLDHFKYVNDRYGHEVGDRLLAEVSKRLLNCVRRGDTIARLGGDEFAILLLDFHGIDNLVVIAKNIIDEVNKPVILDEITLDVSTSIGIGVLENEDTTPNELLKAADTAMYVAKNTGRNSYKFFMPEMQAWAEEKHRIQSELQNAIKYNEFQLMYQPIYALDDMTLHHSEALLRWTPQEGDPISPDVFIPLAEESGKILDVGAWVLLRAFQQLKEWQNHLGECPRVAINVSTKQLQDSRFRKLIEHHLEHSQIPGDRLELELTETGVMDDPEFVLAELVKINELGISISIDDFGTGYSSLDYLRRLPIDQIKIDRCFVQGIGESQHDEEIIKVIIAVAHTMGVRVVAEGIETTEQMQFLKDCGGDLGQGYLFSRPVDAMSIMDIVRKPAINPAELEVPEAGTVAAVH